MSTKIYYAWRVKSDKLNDFIDYVRLQVYDNAEKMLRKLVQTVTEKGIELQRKKHRYWSEDRLKLENVFILCKEVSMLTTRSPGIDVDFALNIWFLNDYFYITPVGEEVGFNVPAYAEDYGYWNNTDQPEHVSEKEWDERRETWDKINCGDGVHSHNARRLCHSIINMSSRYGDFDFEYEMANRLCSRDTYKNKEK